MRASSRPSATTASEKSCPFTGESYSPQSDPPCPYLTAKKRMVALARTAKAPEPAALAASSQETAEMTALGAVPAPSLKAAAQGLDLQFRRRGRGWAFWRKTWKDTSPSKAIELASKNKAFDVRSPGSEWSSVSSLDELKMLVEEAESEARVAAQKKTGQATAQQVASSLAGVPLPSLAGSGKVGLLPFARGMVRHYDNPVGFLQEFHAKHGRSFQVNTPTHGDFLFDTRPEVLMEALTQTDFKENTWKKSELQAHGASFLIGKTNMFTSGGSDWQAIRDAMKPHFKAKNLRSPEMIEKLTGIFDDHLDELKARVAAAPEGELTINAREEMQTAVLDVAFQVFMSAKLPREELLKIQDAFNTQMSWLPEETVNPTDISLSVLPGNGKLRKAYKTLDKVAQGLLDDRRSATNQPDDVLGSIIGATHPETGEPLSDERIKHEILSLLEAGHETTATLMGWSVLMMAKNPGEFQALQQDVDELTNDASPTRSELKELDRADRVVKETLRMYPPFYLFMREATQDTTVGGVQVKAGTTLVSSLYEAHRDEDMWGEEKTGFPANEFHSDRFLERAPERFVPFGAGRRSCLGQVLGRLEGSLMLTRVAQEFDIAPAEPGPVALNSDLSIHPKDGEVTLRLRERSTPTS